MTSAYRTGAELLGTWFTDVQSGTPPVRYMLPAPFDSIDLRPGRLLLLGGSPGSGKTAMLMQIAIDLLRANDTVRLLIANVETTPQQMLERAVSRLAAVPLTMITDRSLSPDQLERVRLAAGSMTPVMDRLAFMGSPFSLEHVACAATEFQANVLILDYVQRFSLGDASKDKREQIDSMMTTLRRFCDMGLAVLLAAAVARQKSMSGSSYRGLNLASFRGSSELEYAADAAYLLLKGEADSVELRCEKNRGPIVDILASFDPSIQTFTPAPSGIDAFDAASPGRIFAGGEMTRMPFGKHKNKPFSEIPVDYLRWLQKLDLSAGLRSAVEAELQFRGENNGRQPSPTPPELDAIVKQWYRRLVLKWHPDRGGSNDAMQAINDAYESLCELIKQHTSNYR